MRLLPLLVLALALTGPALAEGRQAVLDRAIEDAIVQFERAKPGLSESVFGVNREAYHDALTLHRFHSDHWGGAIGLDLIIRPQATGSCTSYAAFVRLPPERGQVQLVLCPQFFAPGAEDLRAMTILHEMVHVVAGTDECRAMAFTALVQKRASGRFMPVERYWQVNGCPGSGFPLP